MSSVIITLKNGEEFLGDFNDTESAYDLREKIKEIPKIEKDFDKAIIQYVFAKYPVLSSNKIDPSHSHLCTSFADMMARITA